MKTCTKCGKEKPLTEFGRHTHCKEGVETRCKECVRVRAKAWLINNPEKARAARKRYGQRHAARLSVIARNTLLKRKYGLTTEQYDEMVRAQGGLCAICRKPPTRRRLAVDHCHKTGTVRGLLCDPCNSSLGRLGDNQEGLLRALNYLDGSTPLRSVA